MINSVVGEVLVSKSNEVTLVAVAKLVDTTDFVDDNSPVVVSYTLVVRSLACDTVSMSGRVVFIVSVIVVAVFSLVEFSVF